MPEDTTYLQFEEDSGDENDNYPAMENPDGNASGG
jgi:hypothetical protein